jgi:single-strand DNA-binding protein
MNDLTMTVTGWVATDPKIVMTRESNGTDMCSFRVAQTSRYFDRAKQVWTNGKTEWFTVRVFRDAAWSVSKSVRTGQPVIVEGRLRTNEWKDSNNELHVDLQLDASCVGHDLTRGVAEFTRAVVADQEASGDEAAEGGEDVLDSDAADVDGDVSDQVAELEEEERAAVLA